MNGSTSPPSIFALEAVMPRDGQEVFRGLRNSGMLARAVGKVGDGLEAVCACGGDEPIEPTLASKPIQVLADRTRIAQVVLQARLLGGNPTALSPAEAEKLLRLSGRS